MAGRPRGLGRTPGSGRKKGTLNSATLAKARALVTAGEVAKLSLSADDVAGMDALATMTHCMKTALLAGQTSLALDAARSLAPFLYPRLQAVAMSNLVKRNVNDFSDVELQAVIDGDLSAFSSEDLKALKNKEVTEAAEVEEYHFDRQVRLQAEEAAERAARAAAQGDG